MDTTPKKFYRNTSKSQFKMAQKLFSALNFTRNIQHFSPVTLSMNLDQITGDCLYMYYDGDGNMVLGLSIDRSGNII
jgi:hypothetical protein